MATNLPAKDKTFPLIYFLAILNILTLALGFLAYNYFQASTAGNRNSYLLRNSIIEAHQQLYRAHRLGGGQ